MLEPISTCWLREVQGGQHWGDAFTKHHSTENSTRKSSAPPQSQAEFTPNPHSVFCCWSNGAVAKKFSDNQSINHSINLVIKFQSTCTETQHTKSCLGFFCSELLKVKGLHQWPSAHLTQKGHSRASPRGA